MLLLGLQQACIALIFARSPVLLNRGQMKSFNAAGASLPAAFAGSMSGGAASAATSALIASGFYPLACFVMLIIVCYSLQ